MAIIECTHCKELFNEDEQFCPYCGEEASVRMTPVRERQKKPQKGRRLFLGLPIGKWIAALIFLAAAALLILCVYICLSLSGVIAGNSKLNDTINSKSSIIEDLTKVEADSKSSVISDEDYGTIETSTLKGYDLFTSKSLGFSALIPSGFKVYEEDGEVYICQELTEDGRYTIPFVEIEKVTDFSDEVEYLQDRHSTYAKTYADDNFDLTENLVKYTQGNKTVFEFQFTHTLQGYDILDTRRAIKVGDTLYAICTMELSDKTIAVADDEINNIIESFKLK